jgi:branched-chain amino acid transport system substrate-binding protein
MTNLSFLRPRHWLALLASAVICSAQAAAPVVLGVSAEYSMKNSLAAQSIEKGVKLAIEEINAAGGVLGGRKLELQALDDRGVPARAIENLKQLAQNPDALAVFCGRFSPVAMELAPVANRERFLLLDPWAAADGIANNGGDPNFVFRLSMTDTWALRVMTRHALERKFKRLALFLPNTAWGRSSLAAFEAYAKGSPRLRSDNFWYNWGDTDFSGKLLQARLNGADAILMIANETEGAMIVQQMAAQPAQRRLPLIAHWGLSAGDFPAVAGEALRAVDLVVVQTFSFRDAKSAKAKAVEQAYRRLFSEDIGKLQAAVGFAHAYDLTHLLALAIKQAGSAERMAVRNALEQLGSHAGLVKHYARPFSPQNHEALDEGQVFLARFQADGSLSKVRRK